MLTQGSLGPQRELLATSQRTQEDERLKATGTQKLRVARLSVGHPKGQRGEQVKLASEFEEAVQES